MKFDSLTLNRLKRLQFVAQQIKRGAIKGDRRSSRRGQSIEFADYRDYTPGDDLRRLDWNIYARHERPFIKLMEDEEDLAVYIILDGSLSMDWGEGDENKFTFGRRLAAGLGIISLFTGDLLRVEVWGTGTRLGPMRGQASLTRLFTSLEKADPSGEIDFYQEALLFSTFNKRPGLLILLSDCLFPGGYEEGLKHLQSQGHEIILLHTLTEEERRPSLNGDLRLVDVETGAGQDVSVTPWIRNLYIARVEAWQSELREFCHRRQIRYFDLTASSDWDRFLLYEMRKAGALQ